MTCITNAQIHPSDTLRSACQPYIKPVGGHKSLLEHGRVFFTDGNLYFTIRENSHLKKLEIFHS